ncbi:MAG: exo-alpha-sialidase [Planctomycetales bacterium]|nr:exo-alpha-sialidase [Planctomycetales bacterium]
MLFRFSLLAVLFLSTIYAARAHEVADHGQPAEIAEEVIYSSTAIPERMLISWKGDPATSQAVTWRTDTSVEHAFAQIAVAEDGPLFVEKAKAAQVEATTTLVKTDLGPRYYHAVNFTGLEPETLYVYRVGDRTNWSEWTHFRTASQQPKPFSFVYFGDAQNSLKSHWSRVFREAFADAPRASFMLHAGDLVNSGNRDAEWGEWCAAGGWVNGTIPTIAIPGNHEYDLNRVNPTPEEVESGDKTLCRRWGARFEFPENGPPELLETCYYFDYQGVRFVGLNSMEDYDLQALWLDGVLAENTNRWTVVTHHHPVYSASVRRDNPELRDAWQPIYDKYKVDLVLTGHDHSYGRTNQKMYGDNEATGVRVQSEEGGTVYVVSVSGPKMYERNNFPFVRRAEDTQLYQIISVEGDQLRYQAKTATGALYDAFTLKKQEGAPNELVEQAPATPEARRPEIPDEKPHTAMTLAPSEGNPRNSEGDFIQLKDGRVMFVYTKFSGGASDHAAASLVARFSSDEGATWTDDDELVVANEGDWNVMSVSLLRLQSGEIALFYARKNSLSDCRPLLRISTDEAASWSEPIECIGDDDVGYFVLNNDRVVQLESGRLVMPVALHKRPEDAESDWKGHIMCYLSDDGGKTWRRSDTVMTAVDEAGKRLVAQEPGVVELEDKRLLMFVRSDAGSQLQSYSDDAGVTWSALKPSNIISPVSPATIERIPKTHDLLIVWNNHAHVDPIYEGKRTPFNIALSYDDGKTWRRVKTLADDPHGWYCYTAMEFVGDFVLLGHCAGDRREGGLNTSQITRFRVNWLYK